MSDTEQGTMARTGMAAPGPSFVERLYDSEPALANGLVAAIIGTFVIFGLDGDFAQSLAVALGVAGPQALFTRQTVYSPKSVLCLCADPTASDLKRFSRRRGSAAMSREPALAIGGMTTIAAFSVQFFSGVDLVTALATSAGISGTQAMVTKPVVYSPYTARRLLGLSLVDRAEETRAQEIAEGKFIPKPPYIPPGHFEA